MEILKKNLREKTISENAYTAGRQYYKEGKVVQIKITPSAIFMEDERQAMSVEARVQGNFKIPYHSGLIVFQNSEIGYGYCDCPAFYKYTGYCKHLVAATFAFMDQEKEWLEEAENATDAVAERLIRTFRDKNRNAAIADTSDGRIHIEIHMELTNRGELNVRFKVGETKMYVVKDVYSFAVAINSGGLVEYGKKLKFYHNIANFIEEDREIAEFVRNRVHRKDEFRYYGSTKEWILSEFALDEFLNLCVGREVYFSTYSQRKEVLVRVQETNPKIQVEISKYGEKAYTLSSIGGIFFAGNKREYIVKKEEQMLYCCDREYHEKMSDFLKNAYGKALRINEKDMQVLYAEVLESIAPYVEFKESSVDLDQFMPPEAEAVFYLDAPETDKITCKAVMKYGDNVLNLFDTEEEVIYRDTAKEYQLRDLLKRYLPKWDEKKGMVYCEEEEENVYDFVTQAMPLLYDYGTVMATDKIKRMGIRRAPKVSVGVAIKSDLLELEINTDEYGNDVLREMLNAYQKKKRYYRLKSGEFVSLVNEEFGTLSEMVDGLQISGKDLKTGKATLPLYRALYLDRILKEDERISYDRDTHFKHLVRNIRSVEDSDYKVPSSLKEILRGYQKVGYRWLRTLDEYGFGGILADDMGLGKTLQVITYLQSKKEEAAETALYHALALIVCPASLVYNWENEIQKFAPQFTSRVLSGDAKEREDMLEKQADIFIVSYDTLRRDILKYENKKFYCEITDEAQFIKNQNTQAAKAVKAIHSKVRFALTGTPIENRLSELWSIFDYLMPGYLYGYTKFKKEMETPIVQEKDEEKLNRLQRMLKPFILRRVKKEVLKELPDKVEQVVYSKLEGEQRKLYMAAVQEMLESMKKQSAKEYQEHKLEILAQLTKLRQICCAPELYFEGYNGEHAKIDTALELIQNAMEGGHKILVFSQFANLLAILEEILKKEKIGYYLLTGKTGKEKRISMVNTFNKDDIPVFLISLKAGGTGLNLTAADIVIHLDPWWNVAAQNQATDRAHRIGQENVVTVFNLIARGTIEEKILKMQQRKKDLTDQILSEKDMALHSLTKEELMEILEE